MALESGGQKDRMLFSVIGFHMRLLIRDVVGLQFYIFITLRVSILSENIHFSRFIFFFNYMKLVVTEMEKKLKWRIFTRIRLFGECL